MTDNSVNPDQIPSEPVAAGRQANGAPPPTAEEDRWDHEPTWPGGEYGNDNDLVADGTCDDENNDRSTPQLAAPLSRRQSSLWNEAIARIRASKSGGKSC
jgi:hypothetical protein